MLARTGPLPRDRLATCVRLAARVGLAAGAAAGSAGRSAGFRSDAAGRGAGPDRSGSSLAYASLGTGNASGSACAGVAAFGALALGSGLLPVVDGPETNRLTRASAPGECLLPDSGRAGVCPESAGR